MGEWFKYRVMQKLDQLLEKVGQIMSDQSREDADVQQILTLVTSMNTGVTAIADEIATLKAANPGVNFAGLEGAIGELTTTNSNLQALLPVVPPVNPSTTPA